METEQKGIKSFVIFFVLVWILNLVGFILIKFLDFSTFLHLSELNIFLSLSFFITLIFIPILCIGLIKLKRWAWIGTLIYLGSEIIIFLFSLNITSVLIWGYIAYWIYNKKDLFE